MQFLNHQLKVVLEVSNTTFLPKKNLNTAKIIDKIRTQIIIIFNYR